MSLLQPTQFVRDDGTFATVFIVPDGAKKKTLARMSDIEPVSDCEHRGNVLRIELCDLCGSGRVGQPFDVLQCSLHGECSTERKKQTLRSCRQCQARGENVTAPQPPLA